MRGLAEPLALPVEPLLTLDAAPADGLSLLAAAAAAGAVGAGGVASGAAAGSSIRVNSCIADMYGT
jgi:hypothetical protein